ncbi:MAG TPA: hemerythrin domain-containing protein [Chloroflexota bacterium]|jgi:hypothetical protein|nr:hemerythrin domain-containing protein [Chloroflexota bacterium]
MEADRVEAPGDQLVQELLWIHGILRSDLEVVRRLAADILEGKPADGVADEIARLQVQSPLWQFKANCLFYCRLVHMHHNGEDAHLFPALRRSNEAMGPIVDKLESDHRRVSDILDEVEAAAIALQRDDDPANRPAMAGSLELLAEHLLTHLEFEETSISPTLRTWNSWPGF